MIPKNHGRYPEAEAWIAMWPHQNEVRYWSIYDYMVDLRLIPFRWKPQKPGSQLRYYVYWKAHSTRLGRAEIYLSPGAVSFKLKTFSDLLGDLHGAEFWPATDKPRDIMFSIKDDQELQQAQEAARLAATFLRA